MKIKTAQKNRVTNTRLAPKTRIAKTRTESDSLGKIGVPADRYWGAQTQRSLENFRIGEERMPAALIRALGLQKLAAARVASSNSGS